MLFLKLKRDHSQHHPQRQGGEQATAGSPVDPAASDPRQNPPWYERASLAIGIIGVVLTIIFGVAAGQHLFVNSDNNDHKENRSDSSQAGFGNTTQTGEGNIHGGVKVSNGDLVQGDKNTTTIEDDQAELSATQAKREAESQIAKLENSYLELEALPWLSHIKTRLLPASEAYSKANYIDASAEYQNIIDEIDEAYRLLPYWGKIYPARKEAISLKTSPRLSSYYDGNEAYERAKVEFLGGNWNKVQDLLDTALKHYQKHNQLRKAISYDATTTEGLAKGKMFKITVFDKEIDKDRYPTTANQKAAARAIALSHFKEFLHQANWLDEDKWQAFNDKFEKDGFTFKENTWVHTEANY